MLASRSGHITACEKAERVFNLRLVVTTLVACGLQFLLATGPSLASGAAEVIPDSKASDPALRPGMLMHAMSFPFLLAVFLPFLTTAGRRRHPHVRGDAAASASGLERTRRVYLLQSSLPLTILAGRAFLFLFVSIFVSAAIQCVVFGVVKQIPAYALVVFSFGAVMIAVSVLLLAMGMGAVLSQFIVSFLGLIVLSTMFYADIICPLVRKGWQNEVVQVLVGVNPVLTIAGSVFEVDLLRRPVMYSMVCGIGSGPPFSYSPWHAMSVWYLAVAVVAYALAQGVMRIRTSLNRREQK